MLKIVFGVGYSFFHHMSNGRFHILRNISRVGFHFFDISCPKYKGFSNSQIGVSIIYANKREVPFFNKKIRVVSILLWPKNSNFQHPALSVIDTEGSARIYVRGDWGFLVA